LSLNPIKWLVDVTGKAKNDEELERLYNKRAQVQLKYILEIK
jgi:hypothetical protein